MESSSLKLYCSACGTQLSFYKDTKTCKRCGMTFCSGCYTLRKKLQQKATNDKDKCSGCRRVVAISKLKASMNKSLTVRDGTEQTLQLRKTEELQVIGEEQYYAASIDDECKLEDIEKEWHTPAKLPVHDSKIFHLATLNQDKSNGPARTISKSMTSGNGITSDNCSNSPLNTDLEEHVCSSDSLLANGKEEIQEHPPSFTELASSNENNKTCFKIDFETETITKYSKSSEASDICKSNMTEKPTETICHKVQTITHVSNNERPCITHDVSAEAENETLCLSPSVQNCFGSVLENKTNPNTHLEECKYQNNTYFDIFNLENCNTSQQLQDHDLNALDINHLDGDELLEDKLVHNAMHSLVSDSKDDEISAFHRSENLNEKRLQFCGSQNQLKTNIELNHHMNGSQGNLSGNYNMERDASNASNKTNSDIGENKQNQDKFPDHICKLVQTEIDDSHLLTTLDKASTSKDCIYDTDTVKWVNKTTPFVKRILQEDTPETDKTESSKAQCHIITLVKVDESEAIDATESKDVIFVAEEQTIHLYKQIILPDDMGTCIQTDMGLKEESSSTMENAKELFDSVKDIEKENDIVNKSINTSPTWIFCPDCKCYHEPDRLTVLFPAQTVLESFEDEIVRGLGNTPEDDSNLCDNLLPNQIRYLSLMRQAENPKSQINIDMNSLNALNPGIFDKLSVSSQKYKNLIQQQRQGNKLLSDDDAIKSRSKELLSDDNAIESQTKEPETKSSVPTSQNRNPSGKIQNEIYTSETIVEERNTFLPRPPAADQGNNNLKNQLKNYKTCKQENRIATEKINILPNAIPNETVVSEKLPLSNNTYVDAEGNQEIKTTATPFETRRKRRPTLEDFVDEHSLSKPAAEKEKRQTALETLKAAIQAGIFLPEPPQAASDSNTENLSYSEMSLLLSSLSKREFSKDFQFKKELIQWMKTIFKHKQQYETAVRTNDFGKIHSAFTEYSHMRQECLSWISDRTKTCFQEQKDHLDDSQQMQLINILTEIREIQSQKEKSDEAAKVLIKLLIDVISASLPADENTLGQEAQSGEQSDFEQEKFDAAFTTLLSSISNSISWTEQSSTPCSTTPRTDKQPATPFNAGQNSPMRQKSLRKPFTEGLIKSSKVNRTAEELHSSPKGKTNTITKLTKKNKNVSPAKTPKPISEQDLFHLKGEQNASEISSSGSQTDISNDSFMSDKNETNDDSAEWQTNPAYKPSEHAKISEQNILQTQHRLNLDAVHGGASESNFRDVHQSKTVFNKQNVYDHGTYITSGHVSKMGSHQSANLDELLAAAAKVIGTTVFHVPSDGNCMFSAIVDQLKLIGNFKYTTQSLREKAVQYLRDNPVHEDGTPLECFLSSESWETYLVRMAQETTWGDHLVLNGIAELLECRIVVVTVTREQTSTNEIEPTRSAPETTLVIGLKGEAHFESLRPVNWEERLIQMAKEPVMPKEKKRAVKKPQIAFAAMLAEGRHPVKSQSVLSDSRKEDSDNNKDKEAMSQYTPEWLKSDAFMWDYISSCSTPHLSYILRQLFTDDHILNREPLHFNYEEMSDKSDFGQYILAGPTFECTEVYLSRFYNRCENCYHSIHTPSCDCTKTPNWNRYFCMNDTIVVTCETQSAGSLDLMADETSSPPGYLKLVPVNEASFSNQLVPSESGKKYLKQLKPVEHKVYVQSQYKPSFPTSENGSTYEAKDIIVFQTTWPKVASEWVDRARPSGWPYKTCIKECVQQGCFVIPAESPPETSSDKDTLWQYSFTSVQRYLIRDCLANNQLHTFNIFKVLLDESIFCQDILSTETLTQVFLYASEEIPLELWYKNSSACVLFMLECLVRHLERRHIPNYFMSVQNMIDPTNEQRLRTLEDRLKAFRRFPLVYMLTCAEKHHLGKYRVQEVVQMTIQDMWLFKKHESMATSVRDTFSRLSIRLASIWINDNHQYELGYNQVITAYNEWCRGIEYGLDQIPFDSFINQIVSHINMYEQWMFVFYTKEKFNVQYRPDIFGYTSCHTLKEIIGEAAGRFENTVVPDCVSCLGLEFLRKFIYLLFHQLCFYSEVIPIIEYTINKYGDQLIELTEEDLHRYNTEGANPNYKLQVKQYDHNKIIFDLYVILFHCCRKTEQKDLFLTFLPDAERVCEMIYEEQDYQWLEEMCRYLDLTEKVEEIKLKRLQLREESYNMTDLD